MKILRLRNGIPYSIPFNFCVKGIGVLYNSFPKQGTVEDTFYLQYGNKDYHIVTCPLTVFDRRLQIQRPYGFEFTFPVVYRAGEKLVFSVTAPGVLENDVNLLLYGVPIQSEEAVKAIIQKKPARFLKIKGWKFPSSGVSLNMPFENRINIVSIGLLYAEKGEGQTVKYWTHLPDTLKGYFYIMHKVHYFFDDQVRPLNLISDVFNGIFAKMKFFNIRSITIQPNDLLTLTISNELTANQELYVILEYYE